MVPSLQQQCLYSVMGRLEKYSSQTLSLLPANLRRRLLLLLPVADICRLERDDVFMSGLDVDDIWRNIVEDRIGFLIPELENWTKDVYLGHVTKCALTNATYRGLYPHSSKDLIAFMLFGTWAQDEVIFNITMFTDKVLNERVWLAPQRYYRELTIVNKPLKMAKYILDNLNWLPKEFYLTDSDVISEAFNVSNSHEFQLLLSQVETIGVYQLDYRDSLYAKSLKPLWKAIRQSNSKMLKSVILSACVAFLGNTISNMVEVFGNEKEPEESDSLQHPHTVLDGLKSIEILGWTFPHSVGYSGPLSGHICKFIPFLDLQKSLETLVVEGLENTVVKTEIANRLNEYKSSYAGFEPFYNYLPHIISRPSFKLLSLSKCRVPVNSVKSMISTFLSSPTDHEQRLEFIDCKIVEMSSDIYSDSFPLVSPTSAPCVCGEHKSLCVNVDSPLFHPQWLFEYPKLQLNRLELFYQCGSELLPLESVPLSSTLCCKIHCSRYQDTEEEKSKIARLLDMKGLSEVQFVLFKARGALFLTILIEAFSQPFRLTSLTRLVLERFCGDNEMFRVFLDLLFSMPTEQLANFTLELINVGEFDMEDIIKAWKAKGRGQKMRKIHIWPCELEVDSLSKVAVIVNVS